MFAAEYHHGRHIDTMPNDDHKRKAAEAAIEYIRPGDVVGVGTGSTVNHFIRALGAIRQRIEGAVASSEASCERLLQHGIPVLDLNGVGDLPIYIDGADEADRHRRLIKGGGGALTREKIVAAASRRFVCIADRSKLVDRLGAFPLPIEVIPMARSLVARALAAHGGIPELREGFTSDNGNPILDVRGLDMTDPVTLEEKLNQVPGVVAVGLFAKRPADVLLLGDDAGVEAMSAL